MNRSVYVLYKKVTKSLSSSGRLAPGDTVVVGVSGGSDSVALLHILKYLPGFPLKLVVAHLNHLLRGVESDGDELFVVELAKKWGLKVVVHHADVRTIADELHLSLEEAGRESRKKFFRSIADSVNASGVMLAHHADDQAETVLLRLLRGTGAGGLTAMKQVTEDGHIYRPLLGVTRKELRDYLQLCGIGWREDSSNSETYFLRNRIRHELLPILKTFNPAIVTALNTVATTCSADEDVLQGITIEQFARWGSTKSDCSVHLDRKGVASEETGVRMRLYRHAIQLVKADLKGISYKNLQSIDKIVLGGGANRSVNLPSGITCSCNYGTVVFAVGAASAVVDGFSISIHGVGRFKAEGGPQFIVSEVVDAVDSTADIAVIDLYLYPFPWVLRTFLPGDRIMPKGMTGRKKVKDFFIDRKIPLRLRRSIPLLFVQEELLWIAGYCLSENVSRRTVTPRLISISLAT